MGQTCCQLFKLQEKNRKSATLQTGGELLPQGCGDIWEYCQAVLGSRLGTDSGLVFFMKEKKINLFYKSEYTT